MQKLEFNLSQGHMASFLLLLQFAAIALIFAPFGKAQASRLYRATERFALRINPWSSKTS